jgi:hypothetical protein
MTTIKNVEGEYYSTHAFVGKNNLEKIAEEVLGKDWEAEDDVSQIQAIIDFMDIGRYEVSCSEYDTREDDIIVTKIDDTKNNELRLMIISNFILYYSSDDKERAEMLEVAMNYCDEVEVEF